MLGRPQDLPLGEKTETALDFLYTSRRGCIRKTCPFCGDRFVAVPTTTWCSNVQLRARATHRDLYSFVVTRGDVLRSLFHQGLSREDNVQAGLFWTLHTNAYCGDLLLLPTLIYPDVPV